MRTESPPKPKRPKLKATERTLKALRDRGYHTEVCERFVTISTGNDTDSTGNDTEKYKGGFRKDLFGYMDVLAYWDSSRHDVTRPDAAKVGSWAIQSTSKASMGKHLRDYRRNPQVTQKIRDWLACDNRFSIVGWDYVMVPKARGNGLKGVWKLCEEPVDAEMLEPNAADLLAIKVNQDLAEMEGRRKAAKRKANQTKRLPQPYRKGKDDG